jgi:hypothetical protein
MNPPEIIDISISNTPSSPTLTPKLSVSSSSDSGMIQINNLTGNSNKSVNFGPGADLLMNHGRKSRPNSPKSDIKLSELKSLDTFEPPKQDIKKARTDMLNSSISPPISGIKLNISDTLKPLNFSKSDSNLGSSTVDNAADESTWDGFKKFNEIPVNPTQNVPDKPVLTSEQTLKEKFIYIRKLEALDKKGVSVSKKYGMEDSLDEMKGEYEMIKSDQQRKNSVKFQGKMLMAFVSGIEFLNGKFDPFDIKLDGWGEGVSENLEEYDDVFAELHDKYGGKTKMAPELKLLFMLGGSAGMIHMTNTMFKSAMPGMDDIMRQNPELMQQFTQAAANTMGQQNPGFGNFMSNMTGQTGSPGQMNMNQPPGRPDINLARGMPNQGVNMENQYSNVKSSSRREMKGPSDISDILSGIKTKKVNIKSSDTKSAVRVSDLQELHNNDLNIPRKSKRKPRSERNTVSLNL